MPALEPLEVDIVIRAPVSRVWDAVCDPRRLSAWSPQVRKTVLLDGADAVAVGVRFRNHNEHGQLEWTTHGEIVHLEPCRTMAFRLQENWLVWSFTVEAIGDSETRLVQRRDAPDGISDFAHGLTEKHMGGEEVFTQIMRAGMEQTLQGIKDACEQADPRGGADSGPPARLFLDTNQRPTLHTARLRLAVPALSDAAAILAIAGDARAVEHNPSDLIADLDAAEELVSRWLRHWDESGFGYWCVREGDGAGVVGYCGVKNMLAHGQPVLNLIYRFIPHVWGRGFATEAAQAVVSWAGVAHPGATIIARVRPENAASQGVALKAGLRRDPSLDEDGQDGPDLAFSNATWSLACGNNTSTSVV